MKSGAAFAALCSCSALVHAQVNVTTYHNDNARTGQNQQETALTPANVNSGAFGKLFTVAVDGAVYAQPLILSGVHVNGSTHNVLYTATEHDSVYAIDADDGRIYWQKSLLPTGGATFNAHADLHCGDISEEVGITGTPAIDAATGTLYVVAKVVVNGAVFQYLHALDVATAAEKFGGPVLINASVAGTANDGDGRFVSFSPRMHSQRAALLLNAGHLLIAWGSHCDKAPWHGWLMSYGATSLALEGTYNTSPDGYGNAIWMGGSGPAADAGGFIYVATGNGSWNGTTDLGNSVVKLGPGANGALSVLDYFTPFNQAALSDVDADLSAGGLLLLPTTSAGKQLITIAGKEGKIYLLDSSKLGKYCITATPACSKDDPQILQEVPNAFTGIWGAPGYWNGAVYWAGGNDNTKIPETLKAFAFDADQSGILSASPRSATTQTFNFAGPVPSLSSNGAKDGILWGLDNRNFTSSCSGVLDCQVLYAYDAANLSNMLYNSSQAAGKRDVPGIAVKFTTPTVANGKVYVPSNKSISAFGLLAAPRPSNPAVSIDLTAAADVYGVDKDGSPVADGGLDGLGFAYSSALVGPAITWSGTTFSVGKVGVADAVRNATVTVSAAKFTTLKLLATACRGNQINQRFTVNYTDGSSDTFIQSLSDWYTPQNYSGESQSLKMPYRMTSTGLHQPGPFFIYGYSFPLNRAKSVKAITLPSNRSVVVLAMSLLPDTPAPPVAVKLSATASVYGLFDDAVAVTHGGLDTLGYAYSASLLGNSVTWLGVPFNLAPASVPDGVYAATVALPAGRFSTLRLLACGVRGSQANQTFIVTYVDGTVTRVQQSLSDWFAPQRYPGELIADTMPYRLARSGAMDTGPFYLYGYSFLIDNAKSVKSLTLPPSRNVVVLAATLLP